jgi:hypothetical protein
MGVKLPERYSKLSHSTLPLFAVFGAIITVGDEGE